jgi:hypothetical protein
MRVLAPGIGAAEDWRQGASAVKMSIHCSSSAWCVLWGGREAYPLYNPLFRKNLSEHSILGGEFLDFGKFTFF